MERYRIHADGHIYFVTYAVVQWLPVFVNQTACRIITDSLNYCHAQKGLRINAYVIMPTHFHGIFFDADFDSQRLSKTLKEMRKFTGHQLADYCGRHCPSCFSNSLREAAGKDRERRFWQSSRHAETIETESFWQQKFDYLHENPCRKGLVHRAGDWRFSSASFWLSEGQVANEVVLSGIAW